MSGNNSLSQIPIKTINYNPNASLHWMRRTVQISFVSVLILIPLSGLLHIDPIAGAFVILDRQVWWSDFFLIFGFWVLVAGSLVIMYSIIGTAFCGWGCPQNSLSEWANYITQKFLGKSAALTLDGEKMKVAVRKNKLLHWIIVGIILLATSMCIALIPLLYFYPPQVIWSFISLQNDARLAASLHYIYSVFVLVIFVDITFIRHFMCRFMCVYKVWQHGFKTQQTLHIVYDNARSDECTKCNYCQISCPLDIDPKKTEIYDSCNNCGECISACRFIQGKRKKTGLLDYEIGKRKNGKWKLFKSGQGSISGRAAWTAPFIVLGLIMTLWGAWKYESYHLAVYRADVEKSRGVHEYRIRISNKLYNPALVNIHIEGLGNEYYSLEKESVEFDTVGIRDIQLNMSEKLAPGLYTVLIHASTPDGWQSKFRVQHFVARG